MCQARFNIKVECYFTELEILLPSNAIGRDLMEQVVEKLALKEVWFFGLEFKDSKNCSEWLKLKKKVLSILIISRDCYKSFCFAGFHARCRQTETSAVNVETEVLSRKRGKRVKRQHNKGKNTFLCLDNVFGNDVLFTSGQKIFLEHLKAQIVSGGMMCSADTAVLLASFALQEEHGNYNAVLNPKGFLANEKALPDQ